jgi:3-phenylpropionate/trans-cinnamate dioxygenase ferredoxin reductase subunit
MACGNCARWLREGGGEGSVLLVTREADPPYERPPCSKGYLRGVESREDAWFRPLEWWDEQQIELLQSTSVLALDPDARTAKLSNGEQVAFEQAMLATGANVRRLSMPGSELDGIHYLRTLGNADAIRAGAEQAEHVILIGGSYIGCEVAASLAWLGKRCTIVMQEHVTFERGFGKRVGAHLQGVLEEHGVEVHGDQQLERFLPAGGSREGRVAGVATSAGLEIGPWGDEQAMVVIGAGVSPDVRLAQEAGLEIGERGGVYCSSRLESSAPGIYAGGDMCEYESKPNGGQRLRVEHWDVAFNHGKTVALNMLGQDIEHDVVPYFFSDLADWLGLEYVGPAYDWDEEVLRGSLEEGTFTNWYLKQGRVQAALTIGRSDDLEQARRLIVSGRALDESERAALADPEGEVGA